jgi:hypothetical protein
MPENTTSVEPAVPVVKPTDHQFQKLFLSQDYADHMQLSLNQLETVTLMLQVLDQADGGPAPTE